MLSFTKIACLLSLLSPVWALVKKRHDSSFVPDAVLRVSAQNISIGGIHRYTTTINGTVPGPELRIPEGENVWIRVYNDQTDQNATVVSTSRTLIYGKHLTHKHRSTGTDWPRLHIRFRTAHL